MAEKIYVGKGQKFGQYDQIAISFALEDVKEHAQLSQNGKNYIRLVVAKMKSPDQRGKTHTVYIDQFEKKTDQEKQEEKAYKEEMGQYGPEASSKEEECDIPF